MSAAVFRGIVWRYIPRDGDILDVGALLLSDGRWNRSGEYACLYTALSREGCVAEYRKMLAQAGLAPEEDRPRDIVTIAVTVTPVLDLTDAAVRRSLDIELASLVGDEPDDLEYCRAVADLARTRGVRAILSPSAALADAANLNIYLDGPARNLALRKGKLREPLNP